MPDNSYGKVTRQLTRQSLLIVDFNQLAWKDSTSRSYYQVPNVHITLLASHPSDSQYFTFSLFLASDRLL